MDNPWPSFPCYSHCWVMPIEAKHTNRSFIMNPSLICSGSLSAHPACSLRPFFSARYLCHDLCPRIPDTTCKAIKNLEVSLDNPVGNPVLARRDADGYYYLGTVIKKVEGEKRTFLVRFAKPFAEEDTAFVQPTASSDILEYVNGMRHSVLPGDKVMAPWEPEQKRYGPGTVILGIEHRDPLRAAKEDEEITVRFWNGKKVNVPLGVSLWIPPTQWERIVEMIHMPLTSRKSSEGQHQANCHICSCRPVSASAHACTLGGLLKWQWPYCPCPCLSHSCFRHMCSPLAHRQCICCCFKPSSWLGQPSLAEFSQGDIEDDLNKKLFPQQLAQEDPSKDQPAVAASSSSSCSSESLSGDERHPTEITRVDQAVNTDSTLFDKPRLKASRRPDWKYWKRSHPSSFYNSQGTNFWSSSCGKKQPETSRIFHMDRSPATLMNHSAMFETIVQSPRRLLTAKDVLNHEGIKPFSGGG